MNGIPYEHIDLDIVELVKVLNAAACVATTGSCFGHGENPIAEVIFKVTNEVGWNRLKQRILLVSQQLNYANIDVYQWHRLTLENELFSDWLLRIEVHPRNSEDTISESKRVLALKMQAIEALIAEIRSEALEKNHRV